MSHPLKTPLGRFGIVTSEEGPNGCMASIPAGGMTNPLTGAPTIAPLAMLVDHIGGMINHHRREPDEWTVSSELSLELRTGRARVDRRGAGGPGNRRPARPCGRKGPNALGLCEFTHRGSVVATATVRSFYIKAPGHLTAFPEGPTGPLPAGTLADRMAVRVARERRCGEGTGAGAGPGAQQQPRHSARRGVGDGAGAGRIGRRSTTGRGGLPLQHRVAAGELHAPVLYLSRWPRISLCRNGFTCRPQQRRRRRQSRRRRRQVGDHRPTNRLRAE